MEQESRRKLSILLPWVLLFAVLGVFTVLGYVYKQQETPLKRSFRKVEALAKMRIQLLEAIESEKNAVQAITDEASEEFAARARQAVSDVDRSRVEIESMIRQDQIPSEMQGIDEFNASWTQFKALDQTILALATQNTNLKAQNLSATQCAHEMDRFEASLKRLAHKNTSRGKCTEAATLSYEALTASLMLYALHSPHIKEADDLVMDKIEKRMKSYEETARSALKSLNAMRNLPGKEELGDAQSAFERFMALTAEVLKLSRMNTNVKSSELSLGKKRLISAQCQEILSRLQESAQSQRFKATR